MNTRELLAEGLMNKYNQNIIATYRDQYFADLADPSVYNGLSYNFY